MAVATPHFVSLELETREFAILFPVFPEFSEIREIDNHGEFVRWKYEHQPAGSTV
jgi:hypothetical protein